MAKYHERLKDPEVAAEVRTFMDERFDTLGNESCQERERRLRQMKDRELIRTAGTRVR